MGTQPVRLHSVSSGHLAQRSRTDRRNLRLLKTVEASQVERRLVARWDRRNPSVYSFGDDFSDVLKFHAIMLTRTAPHQITLAAEHGETENRPRVVWS
jgi:hypothetical protein